VIQQGSEPTLILSAVSKEVTYPLIVEQRTLTHPNVLTQSKTSLKNFALGSPIDAKKKIFRPIAVIDFLARIRFTL